MSMNALFDPIKVGNRTAPNRFVYQSMECNDADENGNSTEKTYKRYEELMRGGAGIIFLEAITVTYESRGRSNQLSIMPRNLKALRNFVEEMKGINNKPLFIFQITHSGELSEPVFSRRVTVKSLPGYEGDILTDREIDKISDMFVSSAEIAHDVGADGIDFKQCHGYLCGQLLRPYNTRKGRYGGSWENRTRFTYETLERMRQEIEDPNFLFGAKVTMYEGFPGGFGTAGPETAIPDLTEPLDFVKGLEERGVSFINVSAGNPSITLQLSQPDVRLPEITYLHHGWQKAVKNVVENATVIGGTYSIFRDGKNPFPVRKKEENTLLYWGNKNISDKVVDMIALGRQILADGKIVAKLSTGEYEQIKWCTCCDQCLELLIRQKPVGCPVYDKEYRDILKKARKEEGSLKGKHT
ncbi:NADH oxidase [subsurface metagenome]